MFMQVSRRWQTSRASNDAFGLKDKAAAAGIGYPLCRSTCLSLALPLPAARSASADHLAGALGNSCRLVKATTRFCSRARWVCSVTHATSTKPAAAAGGAQLLPQMLPEIERSSDWLVEKRRRCPSLFPCQPSQLRTLLFQPVRCHVLRVGTTYASTKILY